MAHSCMWPHCFWTSGGVVLGNDTKDLGELCSCHGHETNTSGRNDHPTITFKGMPPRTKILPQSLTTKALQLPTRASLDNTLPKDTLMIFHDPHKANSYYKSTKNDKCCKGCEYPGI